MLRSRFGLTERRSLLGALVMLLATFSGVPASVLAEAGFPYDTEFMMEVRPMKGSKRVPSLDIGSGGKASIDLWCNTVQAQIVVEGSAVSILTGEKTNRQCDPERMRGDDDVLAALGNVTAWRRQGDVLILQGERTMRFRRASN